MRWWEYVYWNSLNTIYSNPQSNLIGDMISSFWHFLCSFSFKLELLYFLKVKKKKKKLFQQCWFTILFNLTKLSVKYVHVTTKWKPFKCNLYLILIILLVLNKFSCMQLWSLWKSDLVKVSVFVFELWSWVNYVLEFFEIAKGSLNILHLYQMSLSSQDAI